MTKIIIKYFVDFKIKDDNKWRLVEIKGRNQWFYKDMKTGKLELKFKSAIEFSKKNNFNDYILILDDKIFDNYIKLKKYIDI